MKILSRPKGNAEEYGRWSVNPYVGCPHGCKYCYLKKGVWKNTLGGSNVKLKTGLIDEGHAYHVAMAEIIENREQIIKDGGLFMTFTSDPLIQQTAMVFLRIARDCVNYGIPVTMLTKDAGFCDCPVYQRLKEDNSKLTYKKYSLTIGWTLTGHDELEPYASSNAERIKTMSVVSAHGFKTWASIEPVIDFDSSLDMIELKTNNTKVCRKNYDHDACIDFIRDVMMRMEAGGGTATVYWKQSFRDFLGDEDFARATVGWHNIVGKDWSIFNQK